MKVKTRKPRVSPTSYTPTETEVENLAQEIIQSVQGNDNTMTSPIVPETTTTPQPEVHVPATPTQPTTPVVTMEMWDAVLERLAKAESSSKITENKVGKIERYVWPLKYRYTLYPTNIGDREVLIPVLKWRSIKKDPTRALVYKNQYGATVENQEIILSLANGEEVKVDPIFLAESQKSELEFPIYIVDSKGYRIPGDSDAARNVTTVTEYVFDARIYGYPEIAVSAKCIN